jgi:hypothetical protein
VVVLLVLRQLDKCIVSVEEQQELDRSHQVGDRVIVVEQLEFVLVVQERNTLLENVVIDNQQRSVHCNTVKMLKN